MRQVTSGYTNNRSVPCNTATALQPKEQNQQMTVSIHMHCLYRGEGLVFAKQHAVMYSLSLMITVYSTVNVN